MKSVVLILAACALTAAFPTSFKLHFRNLFKRPVDDVKSKPLPRIIGGQEAVPHSIPFQAFLEVYTADEGWYCGGSIISQNYILTAAHCGEDAVVALVTLGAHRIQDSEDTQLKVNSTEITVHAEYDAVELTNDVAVIRLPAPIAFTDAIQAVALPSVDDATNDFTGAVARVSGWGVTNGDEDTLSDVLMYVDVEVITNSACEERFGALEQSVICTSGEAWTGSCHGDSGGPLAIDGVLIGVVSFGVKSCQGGFPSGYSRVTSFQSWIADNTDVEFA